MPIADSVDQLRYGYADSSHTTAHGLRAWHVSPYLADCLLTPCGNPRLSRVTPSLPALGDAHLLGGERGIPPHHGMTFDCTAHKEEACRRGVGVWCGERWRGESMMGLSNGSSVIDQSPVDGRGVVDVHCSDTANSINEDEDNHTIWLKSTILSHPLYDQLLAAHIACLRIATPVDQLPRIDAQLAQSHDVVAKYSILGHDYLLSVDDKEDLDQFLAQYVLVLCSFKEQLEQHVRVHAMEAVMGCWELEQSLLTLTGVSPGEGTGATMSDDEDEQADSDINLFEANLDGQDTVGFGPLIPTETERSLMERVREELKHELKQGYRSRIEDIREEILRKRRAGKLPGDTTSVLKTWWQSHSKWPYPTEDEKTKLVHETGLQLKQINNWFINQRKRNWHSNPSSSTALKSKRKR